MLDKDLKKFNEQMADKDDHIIISIPRGYIQQFAEDNCGRKLTEAELEDLSWLVWEEDWYLWQWLNESISQIIKEAKQNKKNKNKDDYEKKYAIKTS